MNEATKQTAQQELLLKLARNKIVDPAAVEATKQAIIASMPPAMLAQCEGMSDVEKALKGADAYFEANGGNAQADPTKKKTTAPQDITMTAEDQMAVNNYLGLHAEETGRRAANSRVLSVLTDKPILASIIVPNAKLIPTIGDKTEANFAKWESALVDTPENKQAFNELKATFMKKEAMEVYINPDAREKTIGWAIDTTDNNGNPIKMNLTKESAVAFLLVKVQGVIQPKGENSIGIRIKWTAKRQAAASDNEGGAPVKGNTSVTLLNRKALQNNSNLSVCTCVIQEVNGEKTINEQFNAKTAKFFTINTPRQNSKGETITRKIRLPGKTSVYKVQRLEEYVNDFGQAERQKGAGLSRSERQKINEAVAKSLIELGSTTSVENNELRTALAEIRSQKVAAPAGFN